jgi:hypothetical protein
VLVGFDSLGKEIMKTKEKSKKQKTRKKIEEECGQKTSFNTAFIPRKTHLQS